MSQTGTVLVDSQFNPVGIQKPLHGPEDDTQRPDIEWIPSERTYLERVERLKTVANEQPKFIPDGWPKTIDSPRAWTASDFESAADYVMQFTSDDIAEIETALAHFKCRMPIAFGYLHIDNSLILTMLSTSDSNK
jgi:hypothetical protein